MSIIRIKDTIVSDLPSVIINLLKDEKTSSLDTDAFKLSSSGKPVDFRSLIDRLFPVMIIISKEDIEQELSGYSKEELPEELKTKLVSEIDRAVASAKTLATSIDSNVLQSSLDDILSDNTLSSVAVMQRIKRLFSKAYYLSDSNSIHPNGHIFITHNFGAIATRISKKVNEALKSAEFKQRLGDYLDIGHTAAKIGDTEEYAFNSPKMTAVLYDIANSPSTNFLSKTVDLNKASIIFTKRTEQLKYSVTVSKEFGNGFLKMFVEIGGSFTAFENGKENNARSVLERGEKFGVNSPVMKKLVSRLKVIKDTSLTGLYNNTDLGRIIRSLAKYAGSPSGIDYINHIIINTIKGEKVDTFKGKDSKGSTLKKDTVKQSITGFAKNISKAKIPIPKLRNLQTGKFTSLASLQSLLNQALTQQIKRNMGNGGRKDILNLRSGRFAESVKVERMSQSREGMISAFYSYMKYPYQTFEPGFKQGRPASRDPKLLISKSIREIAATMVGNKLRAVRL